MPACVGVNHTDTMYHGTKSSIQDCFQTCKLCNYYQNNLRSVIIEASALLCKLSSISVETFHDFAVIYQHVNQLAEDFQKLDVVSDHYFSNSLKSQTQMGQGAGGVRVLHINNDIPFPYDFLNSFLSNLANRNDIGLYLAKKLISIHAECGNTLLQLCVT